MEEKPDLEFNSVKANEAQIKYCEERKAPHFAPSRNCYSCGKDIFSNGGIDVKRASLELITGCPFCHRSYCD